MQTKQSKDKLYLCKSQKKKVSATRSVMRNAAIIAVQSSLNLILCFTSFLTITYEVQVGRSITKYLLLNINR